MKRLICTRAAARVAALVAVIAAAGAPRKW
jgi:hypothetical protein